MRILLWILICVPAFAGQPVPEPQGHGEMRVGADGGAHQTLGAGFGLNFRYGLHDLLDRAEAFPDYTQFEIGNLRLETHPSQGKVYLDELILFRMMRLRPLSSQWEELSWKVEIGGRTVRDTTCTRCGAGNLLGALGAAVQPVEGFPMTLWFLAEAELLGSPAFSGFFVKPSIGPRFGARFTLAPWLNGWVYGLWRWQIGTGQQFLEGGTEWRVAVARNWALNFKLQRHVEGWEGLGGVYTYF